MSDKGFIAVAAVAFAVVAGAHLLRALTGTPLVVGSFEAPVWVSWMAGAVLVLLSAIGFSRLRR